MHEWALPTQATAQRALRPPEPFGEKKKTVFGEDSICNCHPVSVYAHHSCCRKTHLPLVSSGCRSWTGQKGQQLGSDLEMAGGWALRLLPRQSGVSLQKHISQAKVRMNPSAPSKTCQCHSMISSAYPVLSHWHHRPVCNGPASSAMFRHGASELYSEC